MANIIIIDENWKEEIQKLAERFNNFAKKGSMRMLSFLIDKAFNIASDDTAESRYDAAKFLQRVRALNAKLISPYISTLIDSRVGRFYFESKDFVTPSYIEPTVPEEDDYGSSVIDNQAEQRSRSSGKDESETHEDDKDSGLLSWDVNELIKYKIIKNLKKISYDEISSPIKKCACGDGKLDHEDTIWICIECGTAYHENCAKIIAILEGKCRICEAPFIDEDLEIKDEDIAEDENKVNSDT